MDMIPFEGKPPRTHFPLPEGMVQGVVLCLQAQKLEDFVELLEDWFDGRDDVVLVESGTTRKRQMGFVVLEWEECEADSDFLAYLQGDSVVEDFVVYMQEVVEDA